MKILEYRERGKLFFEISYSGICGKANNINKIESIFIKYLNK
jgi:hypothetical protein